MDNTWHKAQKWELDWHGNCANSLNEELKQLVYADKMGLTFTPNNKTPYNINMKGKSVLDIGGGAYSLLLKANNFKSAFVVDPLLKDHPEWVKQRYLSKQIYPVYCQGEMIDEFKPKFEIFDEIWIYNVLEHVEDPERVLLNARMFSKIIRLFEWIDTPSNIGHPQSLTENILNTWLDGKGKVEVINKNGAVGKCYFGVFVGDHYEKI